MDQILRSLIEDFHVTSMLTHLEVDVRPRLILGQRTQLIANADPVQGVDLSHSECLVEVTESDIQELFQRLLPEKVRYVVVDSESNHTVNTRLFRKAPRIHPCSDRWQVRTVIG